MKATLITIDDLKCKLDTFDINEITRLKYQYQDDIKEFNYQLFCFLEMVNKYYPVCKDPINIGPFGININYDNIYYSL